MMASSARTATPTLRPSGTRRTRHPVARLTHGVPVQPWGASVGRVDPRPAVHADALVREFADGAALLEQARHAGLGRAAVMMPKRWPSTAAR